MLNSRFANAFNLLYTMIVGRGLFYMIVLEK